MADACCRVCNEVEYTWQCVGNEGYQKVSFKPLGTKVFTCCSCLGERNNKAIEEMEQPLSEESRPVLKRSLRR